MKRTLIAILAVVALPACADMSASQQRALTGTAAGTAGGALIGAIAGNAAMGAAIGAGAGLVGGMVTDKVQKDKEAAYQEGYAAAQSGQ